MDENEPTHPSICHSYQVFVLPCVRQLRSKPVEYAVCYKQRFGLLVFLIILALLPSVHAKSNIVYHMVTKHGSVCNSQPKEVDGAVLYSHGGQKYYPPVRTDCVFTFETGIDQRFQVTIMYLDISCTDQLHIYNGYAASGNRLFSGNCRTEPPAVPLESTGPFVSVRFAVIGTSGGRSQGFKIVITAFKDANNGEDTCVGDFLCKNGRCIDDDLKCDNADHCGDASDEEYCSSLDVSQAFKIGLGVIIAIVVSILVTCICCIVVLICCCRHHKTTQQGAGRMTALPQVSGPPNQYPKVAAPNGYEPVRQASSYPSSQYSDQPPPYNSGPPVGMVYEQASGSGSVRSAPAYHPGQATTSPSAPPPPPRSDHITYTAGNDGTVFYPMVKQL